MKLVVLVVLFFQTENKRRRNEGISLVTVVLVLQEPMGADAFGLSQKHLWEGIHDARAEKLVSNFGAVLNQNRKGSFLLERKRYFSLIFCLSLIAVV